MQHAKAGFLTITAGISGAQNVVPQAFFKAPPSAVPPQVVTTDILDTIPVGSTPIRSAATELQAVRPPVATTMTIPGPAARDIGPVILRRQTTAFLIRHRSGQLSVA